MVPPLTMAPTCAARAQAIELVDELAHRLEVREQVIEPHEQRQEVVTGELLAITQLLEHVLERVRAVLDR